MLYLLPLKDADYVGSLIAELNAGNEELDALRYEVFAIRIYVTMKASGSEIPFEVIRRQSRSFYDKI